MSTAKRTIFIAPECVAHRRIAPKCATRRRIAPKITARRRTLIAGTGDITDGSGKAASYIRALDMLGLILTRHYPKPIVGGSMWYSFSLADIHAVLPRVPWMLGMLIIDKCHSQLEKALFCVRRTIQNGWSRDMLRNRLSTDLYEREDKAQA